MDLGLPIALVNGVDHFVAQKLVAALLEKDMVVIGIGTEGGKLVNEKGFELRENITEVEERVAYVFDFQKDLMAWKKASEDGAKLEVLLIDNEINTRTLENSLGALRGNWRIFEVQEVYGPEMDLEVNWIGKAIVSAVLNRSLQLPVQEKVRPVEVADVVEAALRACFLSGTGGERFVYGGAEIESRTVAESLQKEAKMTKKEILREGQVTEREGGMIEESWQKLRWVPMRAFSDNIQETLQYFFTIADEVGRKKNNQKEVAGQSKPYFAVEEAPVEPIKEKIKMPFELVTESEIPESKKETAPEIEVVEEKVEVIEEKKEEKLAWIRPINLSIKSEEEDEELVEKEEVREAPNGKDKEVLATRVIEIKEQKPEVARRSSIRWKRVGGGMLAGLGLIVMTGLGMLGWETWGTVRNIQGIEKAINKQQWQEAETLTNKTLGSVQQAEATLNDWGINGEADQALRVLDEGFGGGRKGITGHERRTTTL